MPRPTTLPCRLDDRCAPDVLMMSFGAVTTPAAAGVFDWRHDQVTLATGQVHEHFLRDQRGVTWYAPVARTSSELPTGWCTWARFARDINPAVILANARWLAARLAPYGTRLILIDDGWQGDHRDWRRLRAAFPLGMRQLADDLKALGLLPALWICPFGTDDEHLARTSGHYLLHADGTSVCGSFGGPYTLDPTNPAALVALTALIHQITAEWGYTHLKLDGVSSHAQEYGVREAYLAHGRHFADPDLEPVVAFRQMLAAIARGAGPQVTIGSSIYCPDSIGLCTTMRTGADVHNEWYNGFLNTVAATMAGHWLHNLAWVSDPDYCLVGTPLTDDMARAWVTWFGLTGQFLLFGDHLPDLPASRVRLLEQILPVADVLPMDLFPAPRRKPLLDLKVNHLGRQYELVAAFNYDERQATNMYVDFAALGLAPDARYFVYDYWQGELLGITPRGVFVDVPAAGCRLLTLMAETATPALLSTNRHVLQGWPEVVAYASADQALTGTSDLRAGVPYRLVFGLPCHEHTWELTSFRLDSGEAVDCLPHRGWVEVAWTPRQDGPTSWQAAFTPVPKPATWHPGAFPYMLGARDLDPWSVELFWLSFGSPAGFHVNCDGVLLGTTYSNRAVVRRLGCGSRHAFTIGVADLDGTHYAHLGRIAACIGESLGTTLCLSDLPWHEASSSHRFVVTDRSICGADLRAGGRRYRKGLGTCAPGRVAYELHGLFGRLTGAVAIDDNHGAPSRLTPAQQGRATFRIVADGVDVLPPIVRQAGEPALPFAVALHGAQSLELITEIPAGESPSFAPHGDWLELELTFLTAPGTPAALPAMAQVEAP